MANPNFNALQNLSAESQQRVLNKVERKAQGKLPRVLSREENKAYSQLLEENIDLRQSVEQGNSARTRALASGFKNVGEFASLSQLAQKQTGSNKKAYDRNDLISQPSKVGNVANQPNKVDFSPKGLATRFGAGLVGTAVSYRDLSKNLINKPVQTITDTAVAIPKTFAGLSTKLIRGDNVVGEVYNYVKKDPAYVAGRVTGEILVGKGISAITGLAGSTAKLSKTIGSLDDVKVSGIKGLANEEVASLQVKNPLIANELKGLATKGKDTSVVTYSITTKDKRVFDVLQVDKGLTASISKGTNTLDLPRASDQVLYIAERGKNGEVLLGAGKGISPTLDTFQSVTDVVRVKPNANIVQRGLRKIGFNSFADYLLQGKKARILTSGKTGIENIRPSLVIGKSGYRINAGKILSADVESALLNVEKIKGTIASDIQKLMETVRRTKESKGNIIKAVNPSQIKNTIQIKDDIRALFNSQEFRKLPLESKIKFRQEILENYKEIRKAYQKAGKGTISIRYNLGKANRKISFSKGTSLRDGQSSVSTNTKSILRQIPTRVSKDGIKVNVKKPFTNNKNVNIKSTSSLLTKVKSATQQIQNTGKSSLLSGITTSKKAIQTLIPRVKTSFTKSKAFASSIVLIPKGKAEVNKQNQVNLKSTSDIFVSSTKEKQGFQSGLSKLNLNKTSQETATQLKQGQSNRQRQDKGQRNRFFQRQVNRPIQRLQNRPAISFIPKIPTPFKTTTKKRRIIEGSKVNKKLFARRKGFDVFTKQGVRLNPIPLTEKSALGLGFKKIDSSIKASFYIKPSSRSGLRRSIKLEGLVQRLSPKFRPSKRIRGLIVEKERFRLEGRRTLENREIAKFKRFWKG